MVFVEYRGPDDPKYIFAYDRKELALCIEWMQAFLVNMERRGRTTDSAFDFTSQSEGKHELP